MVARQLKRNALGIGFIAVGDRWNLLILREAFLGARRFQDWSAALGVSDPVLSARLRDLTDIGLLERRPVAGNPRRHEYLLTDPGKDIWQVFVAIWLWDMRWAHDPGETRPEAHAKLVHHSCGFRIAPLLACRACGACGVTPFETMARMSPEYSYDDLNPVRRYRRTQSSGHSPRPEFGAIELLGDRWSTSVLSAALLGAHRFQEFQRAVGSITPLLLSDRLNRFVGHGVLSRDPVEQGKRRMQYRLTAKGVDFFGILSSSISWATRCFGTTDDVPTTISHLPCGEVFEPIYVCNACKGTLRRRDVHFVAEDAWGLASGRAAR